MRMKISLFLTVILWQLVRSCIPNCTCYLDHKGRNAVTCKDGGYVGPFKLDGLAPNIEVLNLTAPEDNTNLVFLAPVFSDFRQLEEIHLTRSNIPQLGENFFIRLRKLRVLNLSQNNITQVVMKNFVGLWNLKELYLDDNRIYSLPSQTFSPLKELNLLSIQHNRISELVPRIFLDVRNLKILKLSGNGLKELHTEVFKDIQELQILECRACALTNMSSQIYSLLPYLHHLDLGDNAIKSISSGEFEYLTNLKTLKLDGNQLQHLDEFIFRYLTELEVLNVARNEIRMISVKAFANMRKLTELNLGYNKLTKLKASALIPVTGTLRVLHLSGNRMNVATLKELLFDAKIAELYLNECGLLEIDENIFPASIVSLHLAGNYLTNLQGRTLPKNLTSLDISRNKFRGISDDALLDKIEEITATLHDNPWSCDLCFIVPMLNRLNRSHIFHDITCQYPYVFEGKKLYTLDKKQLTWCNTNNYKSSDANFFSVGENSKIGIVAAGMSVCFLGVIVILIVGLLCYTNRHAAKYYTHEEKFSIDGDSMFDNHSPLFLERELSFKFPLENEVNERKLSISTIEEIKKGHKITNGV